MTPPDLTAIRRFALTLSLSSFLLGVGVAQPTLGKAKLDIEAFRLTETGQLESYTRQWDADTTSIMVVEDRSDAGSRSISLPIVRLKATGPDPGTPIFWLSGGPGQSNMHSFSYDYFIAGHDHVMVGYRGVDGSVSLACPEVVEALESGADITDPATREAFADAYSECARRLIDQGVDLDGYTPLDVARDIEDARKALGYGKITIVAESYGTRVAYLYSQEYPENIGRMVLVGANPPGGMVWDPYQNDSLLERYGELWKRDPGASERYPDLIQAFRTVKENFPRRWMLLPIKEGVVRGSVNAFLFHTESASRAFDAYVAAAEGDASGLWLISYVGSTIFPTVVNWGDNAAKAVSSDFDPDRDYVHGLDPDDAVFGAPLGAFLWGPSQVSPWPIRPLAPQYKEVRDTDVPTLFVSGSLDFSTPARNTERKFLPHFPNGRHVIVREAGHILDLWRSQPEATRLLITTFIDRGIVDDSGFEYRPVNFEVSWGFPILAKIIVGTLLFVAALVVLSVWLVVRRLKGARRPRIPDPSHSSGSA